MEDIKYIENHCRLMAGAKCVLMIDGEYYGFGGIRGGETVVDHRHGGRIEFDSAPIEIKETVKDIKNAYVFDDAKEPLLMTLWYLGTNFKILPAPSEQTVK